LRWYQNCNFEITGAAILSLTEKVKGHGKKFLRGPVRE
jgi:hypothetical protein